jgi:hypothetical protein
MPALRPLLTSLFLLGALLLACAGLGKRPSPPEPVGTTCASNDDCVLDCSPGIDCCHDDALCGCEQAVHKDESKAYSAYEDKWCPDSRGDDCKVASCPMPEYDVKPVCRGGQCQTRQVPRTPQCQSDDDCVIFCPEGPDCCGEPCTCELAFHKDAAESFSRMRARTCEDREDIDCPVADCDNIPDPTPVCRQGTCVAKPAKR